MPESRSEDYQVASRGTRGESAGGPVMLAQSTFRRSEEAVALAIERAADAGELIVVKVIDVNLARYLIGADLGLHPDIKDKVESEMLAEHEAQGRAFAEEVVERARRRGIGARVVLRRGRFALVVLEIAREVGPRVIVTTRSRRPEWVKRFFGSPVSELIASASCPVLEA